MICFLELRVSKFYVASKWAFRLNLGDEDPTIQHRDNASGAGLVHVFRSIIHVGLCDGQQKRGAEVLDFLPNMTLEEGEMNELSD